MLVLAVGLLLFIGPHLLPVVPSLRSALVARLGEKRYKGAFALTVLLGLVLIVVGFRRAPAEPLLFMPLESAVAIGPIAIPIAFVLFAAANMPTHIRRAVSHPMLLGLLLWALVHLLANGDPRSTVLFGAFAAYAAVDLASAIHRHAVKPIVPQAKFDVIAIALGIVVALVVMIFHRPLFGAAVVSFGV